MLYAKLESGKNRGRDWTRSYIMEEKGQGQDVMGLPQQRQD
jgi:hypothetical protein